MLDVDGPLKLVPSAALFGGVALYLVGHILFRLRNMGSLNLQRTVVAVLLIVAIPIGVHRSCVRLTHNSRHAAHLADRLRALAYREVRHQLRHH